MQNSRNNGGSRRFNRFRNKSSRQFNKGFSQKPSFFRSNRSKSRYKPDHMEESFYVNKEVTKSEEKQYEPIHLFSDFQIHEKLKKSIEQKHYKLPTPIQDKCIPLILDRKDVIGLANTGTGKTAAFLIPLIHQVISDQKKKVLIIAPTRELAGQINKELISFVKGLNIYSALITGGADMRRQIFDLRRKYNFVIGTPGRLLDLMKRKTLRLDNISNVVIDEADHMLDMGFIDDIRSLLDQTKKDKQTLLFSATLAPKIESLINDFLTNPVKISVRQKDINNIYQDVIKFESNKQKTDLIIELLKKPEFQKVLVFTKTKRGADELSEQLFEVGVKNALIHGDKQQSKRRRALASFKKEHVKVMIATDVAARGLDIDDVTHVINYDVPATKDDYTHRIGRTARANKTGVALTFIKQGKFSERNNSKNRNFKRYGSRYKAQKNNKFTNKKGFGSRKRQNSR